MHYIVINTWSLDSAGECDSSIIGVKHTLEEAKELFNQYLNDEKELARKRGWTIYADEDTMFDAGEDGNYVGNHVILYIEVA